MKSSKYVGVKWRKYNQKWVSEFIVKGVKYNCGAHDTELEAVKARDLKIIKLGFNIKLQVFSKIDKDEQGKTTKSNS
jgi:hypothetical protein